MQADATPDSSHAPVDTPAPKPTASLPVGGVALTWAHSPRVTRLRRRSAVVDVGVGVVEGWTVHRTGRGAALLAHYGFISVFPLLLVFTAVLGFVLEDSPELQKDIVDSALANIPIIGSQIQLDPTAITGSVLAFVIGLGTALWAGTKAFVGAHVSMDDIWELPFQTQANFALRRVRALGVVLIVGAAQVASAAVTALAGAADIEAMSKVALLLGAYLINVGTLSLSYQLLVTRHLSWRRQILPGAALAALAFSALQYLGTVVVSRAIARASDVYGAFASVIALLSWLSLHATAALGGVELNAALHRRRIARAFDPEEPADSTASSP